MSVSPLFPSTHPQPADAALVRAATVMRAIVAAYALMAHADGEVAPAERRRLFAILRDNPAMTVFSHEQVLSEVAEHEANFRYDPEVAQQIARETLAIVRDDGRAVHQVLTACRTLIAADGVAHPAEFRALAEIRSLLGRDNAWPAGLDWTGGRR